MSRRPSLLAATNWAVRRPRAAIRLAREDPPWLLVTISHGLPMAPRRVLARPIQRVAGMAVRRPGRHRLAAPLLVGAHYVRGDDAGALAIAERLGSAGDPVTAGRLARMALVLDAPLIAARLVDGAPEDDGRPESSALRGEIALRLGRYRDAIQLLDQAQLGRASARWARLAERARAEVALLDQAWHPTTPLPPSPTAAMTRTPGRIVHLLTNSLPQRAAGYGVRAQHVARCQQDVGLDPRMVTRAGFPGNEGIAGAPRTDVIDGVTYERIRPNLEPGVLVDRVADETARGLDAIVRRLRPAALQPTTNYVNAQVALAVGDVHGLPVLYEVRGFLEETWRSRMGELVVDGDRYAAAREVETTMMRRAAAVVTLSETMRADILGRDGLDPERVVVVPNAVDVARFRPGPRDPALAQRLGIGPDEPVVGYISSLVGYEGIATLIAAVAALRRDGRRLRLLLVGEGEQRPALEAAAAEAGLLEDRTAIFTGRVPYGDIQAYYRLIDVFVVPRTADRVAQLVTPLKPYEAMAMARPIVVSDVGALLEIVEDGHTGRSFRAEDPNDLAEVVGQLLDDPDQRVRLGQAARDWVAANRTWDLNGQRYLELYRRLGIA